MQLDVRVPHTIRTSALVGHVVEPIDAKLRMVGINAVAHFCEKLELLHEAFVGPVA